MKEEYKIGDILLVRGGYHVTVIGIKQGWFGPKYICKWTTENTDYVYTYGSVGTKRPWQILCKN